jgi:hypothetical protein
MGMNKSNGLHFYLNLLKSSGAFGLANVELKAKVSEISSASVVRVDVINDHTLWSGEKIMPGIELRRSIS